MASEEYKRIAHWLYKSRRSCQPTLSQEAVANVAGVSLNTYRKWEEGQTAPDVVQIERIKKTYGWVLTQNC
jgi:DNA-binding XRE family transcriptional regulator